MGKSVIAHSLSYLAYGKAVTLDSSPARLVLGASTKTTSQDKAHCVTVQYNLTPQPTPLRFFKLSAN